MRGATGGHGGIADGVENGDADAAREAVHRYTQLAKERVREILAQTGGRL